MIHLYTIKFYYNRIDIFIKILQERKQAMKDSKREKRKTKIPKAEKKRKVKTSKGKR